MIEAIRLYDRLKIQGYNTYKIARYLKITEKPVYRRMDRLKEKMKKIF